MVPGKAERFKHNIKKGLVTLASHRRSDDIAHGTLASILRQAKIEIKSI